MKKNSDSPLISVVVPIYDVEEFLPRCIDSILQQNYGQLDIILVDDESPDNCPEICERYAVMDKRVSVIHKRNGGLSDARNAGLKKAKGKYVAFIDADDYVDAHFIQVLLENAIQTAADISICSYFRDYGDKLQQPSKSVSDKSFSNLEAMQDIFGQDSLCEVMTWNKLYKTEMFTKNNITFPVGRIHEDNFTTYRLFYYSSRVSFINKPLYYYVQRPESIMGRRFSHKSLDMIYAADDALEWVVKHKLPLAQEVMAYRLAITINLLNTMLDDGSFDSLIWSDLSSWVKYNRVQLLRNRCVPRKHAALVYVMRLGRWPYLLIRKMYSSGGQRI